MGVTLRESEPGVLRCESSARGVMLEAGTKAEPSTKIAILFNRVRAYAREAVELGA